MDSEQQGFNVLVKALKSKPKDTEVIECAIAYISEYYDLELRDLICCPLKEKAEIFIDGSLELLLRGIVNGEDNRILLQTYSSITYFMPLSKDYSKKLYQLVMGISGSTDKSVVQYAPQILRNILANKPFLSYCSEKEYFLNIYKVAKPRKSKLLYDFLYNVIQLTKKLDVDLSDEIEQADGQQLTLIVALQVKQGKNLNFNQLSNAILRCEDCDCLVDIYKKDNKVVHTMLEQILKDPSPKLLESFVQILNNLQNIVIDYHPIFDNLKLMQKSNQILFIKYIFKQDLKIRGDLLENFVPPWKYLNDCECLNETYIKKMKSNEISKILNKILLESGKNELKHAFDDVRNFGDYLIALIKKADDYEATSIYFDRIVSLISQDCSNALDVIFAIIKSMPLVTFKKSLFANMSVLSSIPKFVESLPSLIESNEETRELIDEDFIELLIENGMMDALAALASKGPYSLIDKVVLSKIDSSSLSTMSQIGLIKLAHAFPQAAREITGPLRIPSLITRVTDLELATYYDTHIAGKYLLENDLVNIDSPVLKLIATQYLTTQLASELISRPDILIEITSLDFPNADTYQIDGSKKDAYISDLEYPLEFEFRVEACSEKIIFLHFFTTTVEYFNNELYIEGRPFKCLSRQWHKMVVNYVDEIVNIHLDDKEPILFPLNKWFITIGSIKPSGKGIFYVKKSKLGKIHDGVYCINYRGFVYHAPYINALPRLFTKLLNEKYKVIFKDYFEILFNLQVAMKIEVSKCIGMLKIILINKSDFITKDLIDMSLNFIVQNGRVNWDFYELLFLDYNLWYQAISSMESVAQFIIHWYKLDDPSRLSLFHFFIDLIIFGNIVSPTVVSVVEHLCKIMMDNSMTVDILYNLLNKDLAPQIKGLFEENSNLLSSIPLQYISHLPDDLATKYITDYSIRCITDDIFDWNTLMNLLPSFTSIVTETSLWVALFTLLTNKSYNTVQEYNVCQVVRPQMFHILFNLVCDLYEKSEKPTFLIQVVDCLDTIIKQNNINLIPYFEDLKIFIHLGQIMETNVLQPIYFHDQFEPCRMPVEKSGGTLKRSSAEQFYINHNVSTDLLIGTNQWFGNTSKKYKSMCDKLIDKIPVEMAFTSLKKLNPMNVKQSGAFRLICNIILLFLLQLNESELQTYFPQLVEFGMNVDPELSISIHQSVILSYISATSPCVNALIYIEKMVCAGWWENRKNDLFNLICMQYERPYNSSESWKAFGNLILSILCITEDFSKLQLLKSSDTLFHQNLLKDKHYFFCMLHFLSSESLRQQVEAQTLNDIWSKFLEKSSEINLAPYFGEIFNSKDQKLVTSKFIDTSRNSGFFSQTDDISMKIMQVASNRLNEYVQSKVSNLKSIYQEISFNRLKNHVDRPASNITNLVYESKCIRLIEKYAFETRYNIISLHNEQNAFKLWTLLAHDLPKAYQIAPSVHPISAPSLYIPFVSKIDLNKYNEYKKFQSDSTVFGGMSIQNSLIPRCLESFVSIPFFEIGPSFQDYLFQQTYKDGGKIKKRQQISILYSSTLFEVLLIRSSKKFYFIINAVLENDQIVLKSHKDKEEILAYSTFLDALSNGYYGSKSLFLGHVVLECTHKDIMISCQRVYLRESRAIEIWFSRGFSLFIVFESKEVAALSHTYFKMPVFFPDYQSNFSIGFSNKLIQEMNISLYTNLWVENKLSTFIYLLIINFFSDRSFSNLSQYPVMPWIHPDRDLSKPMGQQTQKRGLKFEEKYQEDICSFPFFYGSTYSTPGDVFRLLVRIHPYTIFHIDLNKGFGVEERNFVDIETEWKKSSGENDQNVEELIPEFFCVPEIFTNANSIPIKSMSDFKLPTGSENVVDCVNNLRETLENTRNLNEWIDLIFGSKVHGKKALKAKNIFLPTFYGVVTERWDDTIVDTMMTEFGVAPTTLFNQDHVPRNTLLHKRYPQLSLAKMFLIQKLNSSLDQEPSPDLYLDKNETGFHFSDPRNVIRKYLDDFSVCDGILTWEWSLDELQCCKFSPDGIMFAAAINPGAFVVYRLIYKSPKEHEEIVFIGCYLIPSCYLSERIACCDISSHLSLLVAASGMDAYCFHISSKKFIRQICFQNELMNILISNTFNSIYGVGKNTIEAFTINGTQIASGRCDDDIICSAISHNDSYFYLATGHKAGKINLWETNSHEMKIELKNTIQFSDFYSISAISIIGNGSNLFVADTSRCCSVVATTGGECIIDLKWVERCANCTRKPKKYTLCKQCGLYYCKNCIDKTSNPVCKKCLQFIAEQIEM